MDLTRHMGTIRAGCYRAARVRNTVLESWMSIIRTIILYGLYVGKVEKNSERFLLVNASFYTRGIYES